MALDDTIALLARAPIIGLFERDALRLLAFSAETRRLRGGEMLFDRGDRSDGGYVLADGRLALSSGKAGPDPEAEPVIVGAGSLIGRVALFARVRRPARAVAVDPAEVLRISPTLMRRVLTEFPAAADAMHDEMAADLADLSVELERMRQTFLQLDKR